MRRWLPGWIVASFCLGLNSLVISALNADEGTYVTPATAGQHPDFQMQGEYADDTTGLQVVALGDGQFRIVHYAGGLPGAGWDGENRRVEQGDSQRVSAATQGLKRVERKSPTLGKAPPADAIMLFDGTRESVERHWQPGARLTDDGLLMQGCMTIDTFTDFHAHLEFRLPFMPNARGQQRGNSGAYWQGRYETQMLDSFGLEGADNECGGLYRISAPKLNMCFPPLSWQTYDVEFTAARFDDSGQKSANARLTVYLNGVLVQDDVELPGDTTAAPVKEANAPGPLYLQDHGNPVRYRNIWVQPK